MATLKENITGKVKFVQLKENALWYLCETGFEFPVPIEDTHGAIFLAEDKGLLFMRWIRKHMEYLKEVSNEMD